MAMKLAPLALLVLLPTGLFGQQLPDVRVGDEVRVHNDSTHVTTTGRISRLELDGISIVEHLDWPAVKIDWGSIDRIEKRDAGQWTQVWKNEKAHQPTSTSMLRADTTWTAGSVAGAAAARQYKGVGYVGPAMLSALPIGFFGVFVPCGDCGVWPKAVVGVGVVGLILTSRGAHATAERLPPEVDREIRDQPPAYQAGFREGYRQVQWSRFTKQMVGGALMGTLTGFAALAYMFSHID